VKTAVAAFVCEHETGVQSMTDDQRGPRISDQEGAGGRAGGEQTLAEDLLLVLFQPQSGTIAGEGTLSYVLAGAVLADLGLGAHVRTGTGGLNGLTVEAVADNPPPDAARRHPSCAPRRSRTHSPDRRSRSVTSLIDSDVVVAAAVLPRT
jgi:hypothetical protein